MTSEHDRENSSGIAVGVNLGMAVEQALHAAHVDVADAPHDPSETPVEQSVAVEEMPNTLSATLMEAMTEVAHEKTGRTVPPEARIVAVEFPMGTGLVPSGNITVFPYEGYRGRIVIGPPHGLSGRIASNRFLEQLNVVDLEFARFEFATTTYVDRRTRALVKEGTIKKQGSLVNNAPGVWECSACGHVFNTPPKFENKLRKANAGDADQCNRQECVDARRAKGEPPARLIRHRTPSPQLTPSDPLVEALYKEFCTDDPVLDETALIPRIWGVYPINAAPTDWVPAPDDWKAQLIEMRMQQKGDYTIRPYSVTKLVQQAMLQQDKQNTCKGLIVEVSIDRNGVHGPAVGWLRPCMLNIDPESPDNTFGYTIRFHGSKHFHRHFAGPRNTNNFTV